MHSRDTVASALLLQAAESLVSISDLSDAYTLDAHFLDPMYVVAVWKVQTRWHSGVGW